MKYLKKSLKYFVALCVLYVALMWLMHTLGWTPLTLADDLRILIYTPRGWAMVAAVVVLSALYPRFGFVVRRVEGDVVEHRRQILTAMQVAGWSLREEDEAAGVMRFRADALHRVTALWEDEITVRQYGQWIEIGGLRRTVVRTCFRLEGYIANANRQKE